MELKAFDKEYASHPFATPGSLEYQKLEHLDQLIHRWMGNKDGQADEMDIVRELPICLKNRLDFFFSFSGYAKLDRIKWAVSGYNTYIGELHFYIHKKTHIYEVCQ